LAELPVRKNLIGWFSSQKKPHWLIFQRENTWLAEFLAWNYLIDWTSRQKEPHWLISQREITWFADVPARNYLIGWSSSQKKPDWPTFRMFFWPLIMTHRCFVDFKYWCFF
jgi:hypothetical protein